jgi:hypothetical protein
MENFISITLNLISSLIIVVSVWFKRIFTEQILITLRSLKCTALQKKYVLVWHDGELRHTFSIARALQSEFPNLLVQALESPINLLSYPLKTNHTSALIMINSDVTKLSEKEQTRNRKQEVIVRYLQAGGGMIATHDMIYRRVRNDKLEKAFGCQLNEFERSERPVTYKRNPNFSKHLIAQGLPESFSLNDGEVCWGNWPNHCTVIFQTTGRPPRPLVVASDYYAGKLLWLNSGDKRNDSPRSIAEPEQLFISLLNNGLKWLAS